MGQQTTGRRTIGVVVFDGQAVEDVGLGDEVKSGNTETVEAGLVFDSADPRQRGQKRLVTIFWGIGAFPDFKRPDFNINFFNASLLHPGKEEGLVQFTFSLR
jgi:hypothetical protein